MMSALGEWIAEEIPPPITDDAAGWLALLDSERCTEADRLAFARWLDEDRRHRWAFQELSEVWAQLRTLDEVRPLMDRPGVKVLPSARPAAPPAPAAREASRWEWSTVLACVLAVTGMAFHVALNAGTQRFVTDTAEIRTIALSDGTRVELNARSVLAADIGPDLRQVRLDSGEAVFHVAKDPRPFVVSTRRGAVSALGTSFAVREDESGMEVSVLEGRVAVTLASSELPLTVYDGTVDFTPRAERAVLGDGQRVDVSSRLPEPRPVSADEIEHDLAWRNGWVVYEQEPLRSMIRDFRRYSRVSIHLADRRLEGLRISGRFPIGDSSALLSRLQSDDKLVVERGGPRWVVLRAGPETRLP